EASAGIFLAAFDDCRDDCCKFFIAFGKRHRALGLHFKTSLFARPRRGLDDDVVKRMTLTAALELEPIDDRAWKTEDLRFREHGRGMWGCDFCLNLRPCRSRCARAGILLCLCGLCHRRSLQCNRVVPSTSAPGTNQSLIA